MSQEIIFTTLPHRRTSVDGQSILNLSVSVSIRLTPPGESRLSEFPDILSWPEKILNGQFSFRLGNGAEIPAELITEKIDPQLFGSILHEEIRIRAFRQENLSSRLIHSVPLKHVSEFILNNYRKAAVEQPTRMISADKFIDPAGFGLINRVRLSEQEIVRSETRQLRQPLQMKTLLSTDKSADQQFRTTLRRDKFIRFAPQMNPVNDFAQLRSFHRLDAVMKPMKPIEIKKPQFEFHDILAITSNYPQIMRRLGFVLDFTIPYQNSIPSNSSIQCVVSSLDFTTEGTVLSTPPTAYQITAGGFYPADRPDSIFRQGFVRINTPAFSVIQADTDGAAIKASGMAESKAREIGTFYQVRSQVMVSQRLQEKPASEPEPPAEEGLPSMRSSGIGIVRNGMAEHIYNRFEAALKLNPLILDPAQASVQSPPSTVSRTLTAEARPLLKTASPLRNLNLQAAIVPFRLILPRETLYSDDLVEGYRMDIAYEDNPGKWFSLHQRQNDYTWYDAQNQPHTIEEHDPDEGYLELAVTENPDEPDDVYVPETLARWEGWSLSVRRPGYAINEADDDPSPSGRKRDFVHTSKTAEAKKYAFDPDLEFRLNVQSKIVPGTLPRLRFGRNYRIRIRTVDLAGNSMPLDHKPDSETDIIRSNIRYMRYEPLSSPVVLTGNPIRDGEFNESLVIRSNNDKTAEQYEIAYPAGTSFPGYSLRYLLPPKSSQQMAENHGMFEKAFARNPEAVQTIYNLITSLEGVQEEQENPAEKIYGESEVKIIWLPDPMAAGVAFFVSEGYRHSHTQDFEPRLFGFFTSQELTPATTNGPIPGDWYNAMPIKIRLEEGELNTKWNSADRTFTVYLPKGYRTKMKYSTFWREEDFRNLSAIWQMITEEKPGNLAEIERIARSGQHWMMSPPGEFELVHAVQQPVDAPEMKALIPERDFNQTFAKIHTRFTVHGESTGGVEFQAKWTEPLDDGISVSVNMENPGRNIIPDVQIHYNDETVTFGTIPEPKLVPGHIQMRGPLKIEAIPVQKMQIRTRPEFEKNPQPEAAKVNRVYQMQNAEYAKLQQTKSSASRNMVSRVRYDLEESRYKFLKQINFRMNPLQHNFGDTKHRWVDYQVVASSRYREYFDKILKAYTGLSTTRESPWWEKVNILSSARPRIPEIDYVIPTFEWRKTNTADATRHKRMGGGLRVYLKRPWYSSGADEMLAVVLPPPPPTGTLTMLTAQQGYTDYFTHWAIDPVLYSGLPDHPSPQFSDFRMNPVLDENLQYPGNVSLKANVAAYPVHFDEDRQQWFCDLSIDPRSMYFPFVRLALARYQPYSVKKEQEDVCLSPVVLSTFVQLVPERQTTLRFTKDDQNSRFTVTVEGTIFNERMARYGNRDLLRISFVDTTRAQPIYGVMDDGTTQKKLADEGVETYISQKHVTNNRFSVSMEFRLPREYKTAPFQVVVEEFERGPVKTAGDQIDDFYKERLGHSEETDRLIYADVFKINQVSK